MTATLMQPATFTAPATSTFSMDAHLYSIAPPDTEIDFIMVRGDCGDIRHGTMLAVALGDKHGSPDSPWVMRIGKTCVIRTRREVERMRRRLSMYVVGSETATNFEVVGLLLTSYRTHI